MSLVQFVSILWYSKEKFLNCQIQPLDQRDNPSRPERKEISFLSGEPLEEYFGGDEKHLTCWSSR